MSRVIHPEFEHGRRFVPQRPNILRRVISRYQLVELTVIIGAIFLLWGGLTVAKLPNLMIATQPLAWLESFRVEIIDGDTIRARRLRSMQLRRYCATLTCVDRTSEPP
jgi:hypothetical protein